MPQCEEHGPLMETVGGLKADMKTVVDGQDELFGQLRVFIETALSNKIHLENLNKLYGNGYQKKLESQIAAVCGDFKECVDRLNARADGHDQKIAGLEAIAWFGRFITDFRDNWFKRSLQIGLGMLVLSVMGNAASIVSKIIVTRDIPAILKFIGG